ncbi:MAG: amidohydrolase family protein [Polyangiaceae bacterium]
MLTNNHVHLFSADHAPSAQVYYLLRGALHGAARALLPTLLGRAVSTDDLRRLDRSLDRFEWPWPTLFGLAIGASQVGGGLGLIAPRKLIDMFSTVGRLSRKELQQVLALDSHEREADFLKGIIARKESAERAGSHRPFRDAMCALVAELYSVHEKNAKAHGRVSHREVFEKFLSSPGANQYKRIIALSVNFDEAFFDDVLPGLSSTPTFDFARQAAELEALAVEVNAKGERLLVPFLGIDPRGYDSQGLFDYVKSRVGREKPWKGLKFYPSMGILPTDDRLRRVFDYCQDQSIPVLSHCSVGGAGVRGSDRNFADLSHPWKWLDVLTRLARRNSTGVFRICLAHFDALEAKDDVSWCDEIIQLMLPFNGAQGVEVFSDIAFDVVTPKDARKIYESNVKRVQELGLSRRVMFGSDWWNYLYECENETRFIQQLNIDSGWWKSEDFDAAADAFLSGVCP